MKDLAEPLFFLFALAGCSGILIERNFTGEMESKGERFFRPGKDFQVLVGDTGHLYPTKREIMERTSKKERYRRESLREELLSKEAALSKSEQMSYKRVEKYFENDSERIFYLSLAPSERDAYVQHKGAESESLPKRQLYFGMSQNDVMRYYGMPQSREISGPLNLGRERWVFYHKGVLTYVYFEQGLVQGWSP